MGDRLNLVRLIQKYAREAGITPDRPRQLAGIPRNTIRNILEEKVKRPQIDTLRKFKEHLKIPDGEWAGVGGLGPVSPQEAPGAAQAPEPPPRPSPGESLSLEGIAEPGQALLRWLAGEFRGQPAHIVAAKSAVLMQRALDLAREGYEVREGGHWVNEPGKPLRPGEEEP